MAEQVVFELADQALGLRVGGVLGLAAGELKSLTSLGEMEFLPWLAEAKFTRMGLERLRQQRFGGPHIARLHECLAPRAQRSDTVDRIRGGRRGRGGEVGRRLGVHRGEAGEHFAGLGVLRILGEDLLPAIGRLFKVTVPRKDLATQSLQIRVQRVCRDCRLQIPHGHVVVLQCFTARGPSSPRSRGSCGRRTSNRGPRATT